MSRGEIKNYSKEELAKFFGEEGWPHYYALQVFSWIYKKRIEDFSKMTDISKKARAYLKESFYFSSLKLLQQKISKDGTEKFLFQLADASRIETVLIPEGRRLTLCVSTQVGCKFRCKFCVSGRGGFKRNLDTAEILNQFLQVSDKIRPRRITNLVFMGIGEPLDNFVNVVKSIRILSEPCGIYFGKRRICLSTVGIPSRIEELAQLNLGIKLSLSLHSAFPHKRREIMPIEKKYALPEIMEAIKNYSSKSRIPLTFEYIMIGDFNTFVEDALQVTRLVRGIGCKINLIPYNQSPYFKWKSPSAGEIQRFKEILRKHRVFFTLRRPRGEDIGASCGQLKAEFF